MYKFTVYRDCDTLRLRKVVIELTYNGELVDRRRMFAGAMFVRRLKKKKARMMRLAKLMLQA